MNKVLYDTLKLMLPGLPGSARKVRLTLEHDKPPMVEVEYLPAVEGEVKLPVEFKTDAYVLCPAHLAKLIDVTTIGEESRRFVENTSAM